MQLKLPSKDIKVFFKTVCVCVALPVQAKLLALNLADAFVGEAARWLHRAPLSQLDCQTDSRPALQMTVTHEGILSEVSAEGGHKLKRLIRVKGICIIKQYILW